MLFVKYPATWPTLIKKVQERLYLLCKKNGNRVNNLIQKYY